jgi:hypothetical protein
MLVEAWRDLQYIGDVKAGKFMGQDELVVSSLRLPLSEARY